MAAKGCKIQESSSAPENAPVTPKVMVRKYLQERKKARYSIMWPGNLSLLSAIAV